MAGAWKMDADGNFELVEPYKTAVAEARVAATLGWREGLLDYVEPKCGYSREELGTALERICEDENRTAFEKLDGFVIQALEGDL